DDFDSIFGSPKKAKEEAEEEAPAPKKKAKKLALVPPAPAATATQTGPTVPNDPIGNTITLSLGVGTQKVLSIPGIQRIAIGDPSAADVKALGSNQILVIGQAQGRTTFQVWKANGERVSVVVTASPQEAATAQAKYSLS